MLRIRGYLPEDRDALYAICLATGAAGEDASAWYQDPELLGHVYVGPYVAFEADLCFVLAEGDTPVGYVLGTTDSVAFAARSRREWFSALRAHYPLPEHDDPSPDAHMIRTIHDGPRTVVCPGHPADVHIDLLPHVRGAGWGAHLMQAFLNALTARDVPGVHLTVGRANQNAVGFYCHLGFRVQHEDDARIVFCRSLKAETGDATRPD